MSAVVERTGSAPVRRRRASWWLRTVLKSSVCTALVRLRGIECSFVSCEGRLPQIHSRGTVKLARIALRGSLQAVELGATDHGMLAIGARTFINQGASIVATHRIEIGNDVRIGDFVAIYDTDHHPVDELSPTRTAPVRIGDNVWLGRGSIVLPGSKIGAHSVVAAGSVVNGSVEDRTLVAGNPARPIRRLTAHDGWRRP
jgi:acetyltransferase-like isoleucine patch superfamily enzyme